MPNVVSQRKDARRSRRAILDAARELFAQRPDVPMVEIARRAGVGQATLYRHFPDRDLLVAAIFGEVVDGFEQLAAEHVDDPGAFAALLESVTDVHARHVGMVEVLRRSENPTPHVEALAERMRAVFAAPLRRAQTAGVVRADLTLDDVITVLTMINGALESPAGIASRDGVARRALTLLTEGLKP